MRPNNKFVMPNNNFKTSTGVHQYAVIGMNQADIRRKTDDFHMKLMYAGGQVLSEQRKIMPQGSTYILFTYQI